MRMKKVFVILFVLAGICTSAFSYAQEAEDSSAATTVKPYKVYCEIISYSRNLFSDKTTVELDFGQASNWWSTDRRLVDEDGNTITFNSILDAANYMAARGWVFEQAYIEQSFSKGDSNSPTYHWILSKDITDPSQITEGLQTQGMKK